MNEINEKILGLMPKQLRLLLFGAAAVLRLALLVFGEWQDAHFEVKFTDIDYKVYTDAANHVLQGGSPYERHTYRYSPLVAYLCLPNLLGCPFFGKFLFCCMDMAIAVLIENQGEASFGAVGEEEKGTLRLRHTDETSRKRACATTRSSYPSNISNSSLPETAEPYPLHTFLLPCCCWLFHPVVAAVSARGNADAFPCLLVLLTLAALRSGKIFLAAMLYGLSVHVKLYPVIYGVPMLLYLQQGKELPEGLLKVPSFPKERLLQVVWGVFSAPVAAAMLPFRVCCFLLRRMDRWQWSFGLLSCAACLAIGSVFYFM
ncbi:GPI mannosyltransferase [Cyclospora cayetanensis]|uniref:GPI mannosyltransferase 1 n=1 Tax=Cyclospora cayetanensis TaxID=88456 RepID=A0A1D3DA64_9EIME|nr:GPI mannosyltransferase [Cyclospora cayetanensis]